MPSLTINDRGNTIVMAYDDASRLTSTTRHLRVGGVGSGSVEGTIVTAQTWDDNGRLRVQTDDNSNDTTYDYDPLDRLVTTTFGDGTVETRGYDKRGLLTSLSKANGFSESNVYDDGGRMTSRTVTVPTGGDGTTWETYVYDGLNRVTSAEDDDSSVTRAYDSLGRVVQEDTDGAETTSIYDGVGLLRSLTYPGGRVVTYTYDAVNRLDQLKNSSGTTLASWDWIGPSRMAKRSMPLDSAAAMEMTWDNARRPTGVTHYNSGGTIEERLSEWDRVGNRSAREDTARSIDHAYTYDSAYRLVESARSGGGLSTEDVAYTLDGVGNRTDVDGGIGDGSYTLSASSPPADYQVNQYTATPFDDRLYDSAGNLVELTPAGQTSTIAVTYDFKDRLVAWEDSVTGRTHFYAYDVFGRRISKHVDATASGPMTFYRYSGWRIIEEEDSSHVTAATYVYGAGLDELVSMKRDGRDYYYHQDDLGNVYAISNALLGVVERYEYLDYGVIVDPDTFQQLGTSGPVSSAGNPAFFTGARFDEETGLYWMRNRYMDPESGRFVTRDPLGVWGDGQCFGCSTTYTGNTPWSAVDALGLEFVMQAREVFGGFYHVTIVIIPKNQDAYRGNKLFKPNSEGQLTLTIGGFPDNSHSESAPDGVLNGVFNADFDRNKPAATEVNLPLPESYEGDEDAAIEDAIEAVENYQRTLHGNPVPYHYFPVEEGTAYNSNSFAHGLADYLGFETPDRFTGTDRSPPYPRRPGATRKLPTPGWRKPVPSSRFKNKKGGSRRAKC